jgi:hypothetical protein
MTDIQLRSLQLEHTSELIMVISITVHSRIMNNYKRCYPCLEIIQIIICSKLRHLSAQIKLIKD